MPPLSLKSSTYMAGALPNLKSSTYMAGTLPKIVFYLKIVYDIFKKIATVFINCYVFFICHESPSESPVQMEN